MRFNGMQLRYILIIEKPSLIICDVIILNILCIIFGLTIKTTAATTFKSMKHVSLMKIN